MGPWSRLAFRPRARWPGGKAGWHAGGMKIVVCVKQVPDIQSERTMEDGRLVRGRDDGLNELDENAVEAAVSLVRTLAAATGR